jgi:nitrogen regulatory protein PII
LADKKYEAVFCIINAGFSDQVMFAARKAGASGATILKGRGTTSTEADAMFNITIQPEKEVVIILVPAEYKDEVLRMIYSQAGLESEANGIAFSLPVTNAVGIDGFEKAEEN